MEEQTTEKLVEYTLLCSVTGQQPDLKIVAHRLELLRSKLEAVEKALHATGEFNNFECHYGFKLGACDNDGCLHCRVFRALKKVGE